MTYTKEQQAENRRKWVEALRSGRYPQARHALRMGAGYCCLGVACDISGLGRWIHQVLSRSLVYEVAGGCRSTSTLPHEVRDWLGLLENDAVFSQPNTTIMDSPSLCGSLVEMNDTGASFSQIANIIESEPRGFLA